MGSDNSPRSEEDPLDEKASGQCDFCRSPIPSAPVTVTIKGNTYTFCSEACRDELREHDFMFTEYHGHRRITPEVAGFDASLRQGLPRNSFVLLSAEVGTRDRAIQAELVWRTLQRGEPAVILSFAEPPVTVVQQFLTLEWNIIPYLERGQLHIVDCFTYRLSDRSRLFQRMDRWNAYLHRLAASATTTVRDPSDLDEVENKLDNALETHEMVTEGIVMIDSLTELGTLVQPVQAYKFVKDVRAEVCKGRFVPIFAGATIRGTTEEFPHDLAYVVDGIMELALTDELVEGTLLKQLRFRKLGGVLVIPEWHTYEYTAGLGMVLFDPREELEGSVGEEPEPSGQACQETAGGEAASGGTTPAVRPLDPADPADPDV